MPSVLVTDSYYDIGLARELLAPAAVEVVLNPGPWADGDVVALLNTPDQPVGSRELDALPALRVIATCSVGYDHIDVAAASAHGVVVCNVPDYCVEEMADSTLALLLSLIRGVVVLDRDVAQGGWDYRAAGELRRLRDTRLGVLGFGRIGRAVAGRALALGLEVWATDPAVSLEVFRSAGVRSASLDELLRQCDALTLHVPLSPATEGLIGERELALMRPGAVLVNTARALLVDAPALYAALDSGHLAGAALDVLPVEPPPSPAPRLPTLVINPHAAWYSKKAEAAVLRRPVLSVLAALNGEDPDDRVRP